MIDGVKGQGHYVGTFVAWQQNSKVWWGEGEILMYSDGDREYPTIGGTGTEDYFGGAWGFEHEGFSETFSAPCFGHPDVQTQTAPHFSGRNLHAGSRFRTTWRPWSAGAKRSPMLPFRSYRTGTRVKSSRVRCSAPPDEDRVSHFPRAFSYAVFLEHP